VEFKCKMSEKNLEFDQHLWTSSQWKQGGFI
jgi:hypothetical protein